ncbi:MAG TPA: OmpA family protein [Flavipsychrobacter sp.]|nr:OmpA family protein [Flavipsychrobacter sp.]
MRLVVLLFVFVLLRFCVDAQIPSRAQNFFDKAMRHEAKKEHAAARVAMEKALQDYPAYAEAYSILGAWYFRDRQFQKSVEIFRKAYLTLPTRSKLFAYPYAKSLIYSGNPTEAINIINNAASNSAEWEKLRTQAVFVQREMKKVWKDTVFNMGYGINTQDAEMFPWISTDERSLFLTRRRNLADEDFYVAVMDTCNEWYSAENMGSPPNTANQEAAQMISADGHYLFFMQCENRSENGWTAGGCDLYMSYRADSVWSTPQSFGATINTPAYEGMPCLSPDNRELYFVSNREGGYGGMDIWVARFENGFWQVPRNLGPNINTAANETAPFLHIDNNTLYFSSDGHTGFGGADLFVSQKMTDTTFAKPTNMGLPVNSAADETSLCVSIDGKNLYFASDRDSMAGNFDIYKIRMPEKLQPVPVNIVRGYVYDSLTHARLNHASVYIRDIHTGQNLYHFNSNRGDGSYMITLIAGKKYLVHTDRISYQDGSDTIDLSNRPLKETYYYNIALLPSDYVAPVNDSLLFTINFPLGSQKLSDSDKFLIQAAVAPWLYDMAGAVFFVNSYTDNTGTPMINEQLSYMRAGLVLKELEALGIDAMNIRAKGWGEADPISLNDTEEGRNRNRRVEVILRR